MRSFIALALYFAYFASGSLRAGFSGDDVMNLRYYWECGVFVTVRDNAAFWNGAYRPMGGMFYLPLYLIFGLRPLPYHLVAVAILALNAFLAYRVSWRVTSSRPAALCTAFLLSANFTMAALYFDDGLIYDILSCFFTLLMLEVYVSRRAGSKSLSAGTTIAVIVLYIAALDSKEIAVIGAAWLMAYEMLCGRPIKWRLPAVLLAISVLYSIGKLHGADSLAHLPGYRLEWSLHQYVTNNLEDLNALMNGGYFSHGWQLAGGFALLAAGSWLLKKPELRWCAFVALSATLPISFTVIPRNGPSLYLPWFAWALFLSAALACVVSSSPMQWVCVIVVCAAMARSNLGEWRSRSESTLEAQRPVQVVLASLQRSDVRPSGGEKVIFLRSPLPDYQTYFISRLVWKDRTIGIELAEKMQPQPTETEVNKFDWILTFDGDQIRTVKAPKPK